LGAHVLSSNQNDGWRERPACGKVSVKVEVERDTRAILTLGEGKNVDVFGLLHPEFLDVENVQTVGAQQYCGVQCEALIKKQTNQAT
jgi:hypothetical protein